MNKPLWKTVITIWSDYNPLDSNMELEDIAREATSGDMYCAKEETMFVPDPTNDEDWDNTEFFKDI